MSKRHADALAIQQGAVNPSGMAHALVAACKECIDNNITQRTDAAVQLIVHQLAFICHVHDGIHSGMPDFFDYGQATKICNLFKDVPIEQELAVRKVYEREWTDKPATLNDFLASAHLEVAVHPAVMVRFAGMTLGVERNGYTHS